MNEIIGANITISGAVVVRNKYGDLTFVSKGGVLAFPPAPKRRGRPKSLLRQQFERDFIAELKRLFPNLSANSLQDLAEGEWRRVKKSLKKEKA